MQDIILRLNISVSTVNFALNKLPMGVLKQLAEYLYLRKPDPERPNTQWIRYMHGINRISLLLFIIAIIVLVIRLALK